MIVRCTCWLLVYLTIAATVPLQPLDDFRPQKYDWPQWQGPQRNAVSHETGLLKTWPNDGPPLLWKSTESGSGFSTPSIAAGRIFVMGNIGNTEYIICLSEKGGKQIWKTAVGKVRSNGGGYPGPRCTPTVDSDHVYALGLNGDLVCLATDDGKERWRKDIIADFDGEMASWGYSESPLVDGVKVLVTPGGKQQTIVALDKTTGKLLWGTKVPDGDGAAYSSIVVADVSGQRQYIQFVSHGVVGIAADNGKFLWRYDKPSCNTANCSTPIFHDNHVFAATGYATGGGLAKLTRTGDKTTADEVYFTEEMQNHHGGMVLVDGYLYGSHYNTVCCLHFATGEVMWQSKAPGKGSIVCADGCLYYRNEDGKLSLFEANPKKYVQLGTLSQPHRSDSPVYAHPVIANGRLYLADQETLLCYDVRK